MTDQRASQLIARRAKQIGNDVGTQLVIAAVGLAGIALTVATTAYRVARQIDERLARVTCVNTTSSTDNSGSDHEHRHYRR